MKKIFASQKRLIILLFLLIATLLVINFARQTQNSASHAGGGFVIDHIVISGTSSQMRVGDSTLHMSALAYDSNNQPINGATYSWGISSSGSIGRLIEVSNNIAGFLPTGNGTGDIFVTAAKDSSVMTKSFRMTVGDTVKSPISWRTNDASLTADDFSITVNGHKYTSGNASVSVKSDPAGPPYFDKTTLEAIWFENGVEMRLFLYFSLNRTNNLWSIYDIRTYDGTSNNRWVYYHGFSGQFVGQTYHSSSLNLTSYLPQFPDSPLTGTIHFDNVNIGAFLVPPLVFPNGYYLYSEDTLSIPVFDGNSFPNIWPFLYNNGVFVTDQTHFAYQWSVHDGNIAEISAESVCQSSDMLTPCPESFATVKGIKPGDTIINLTIVNLLTNAVVASKTFGLSVYASTSPTPTPVISTNKVQYNFFLHGRGNGGDNANPTSTGNLNPLHKTLPLELSFYNDFGSYVTSAQAQVAYNSPSGSYTGNVFLPDTFPNGIYVVKAKIPGYLKKQLPGFYSITNGRTTSLTQDHLIVGDAIDDNQLNILDYNLLLDCYSTIFPPKNCDSVKKSQTDFNDDNAVNQLDLNLFLRELSVQPGS